MVADNDVELPDQLMTVSELAAFLNVQVSWVYTRTRRRGAERLPHIKLGKYLRFSLPEVIAWLRKYWGGGLNCVGDPLTVDFLPTQNRLSEP